jgi:hypothetical protein
VREGLSKPAPGPMPTPHLPLGAHRQLRFSVVKPSQTQWLLSHFPVGPSSLAQIGEGGFTASELWWQNPVGFSSLESPGETSNALAGAPAQGGGILA